MFCTIYFCLVSRLLIASFQNGEIEKARDSIKTPRRMAKWHFSHLMKSSIYLVTCQKTQTSLWGNWRNLESPDFQLEERGIVFHFCNCFQTGKFPYLLTSKKYHIISVYCHLLLSMIQSPSSPFSPSSLILPTRLSQSFEPYRTYYTSTITHQQFF